MARRLTLRDLHRAREAALQMLYQWEVGGGAPEEMPARFWALDQPRTRTGVALRDRANALALGTIGRIKDLDPLIAAHALNWRLPRMAVVDRQILRLAAFELQEENGAPAAVVIDEALELARTFSTEEAVTFINGVLDAIRRGSTAGGDGTSPTAP